MKSPPLSNAQSALRKANSIRPLQLSRTQEGFKNLEGEAEKSEIASPWRWGLDPLKMARKASLEAFRLFRRFGPKWVAEFDPEELDDVAQECLMKLLELKKEYRPKSLIEEESFLIDAAKAYLMVRYRQLDKCVRPIDTAMESAFIKRNGGLGALTWELISSERGAQRPTQEESIEAQQARIIINQLPSKLIPFAKLMADGATLPEVAADLNIGLIEAMGRWRLINDIAVRLRDDGLDAAIIRRPIKRAKSHPSLVQHAILSDHPVIVRKKQRNPVKHEKRMLFLELIREAKRERKAIRSRMDKYRAGLHVQLHREAARPALSHLAGLVSPTS